MRILSMALALLIHSDTEEQARTPRSGGKDEYAQKIADSFPTAVRVRGKIMRVETTNQRLVVSSVDETNDLLIAVEMATGIKLNDKETRLDELRAGDDAIVFYDARKGKNVALAILCSRQ